LPVTKSVRVQTLSTTSGVTSKSTELIPLGAPGTVATVNESGSLTFAEPLAGEGGGVVDQGAAGVDPWPVTIPTPVPVTDNAGSLTVDGSVSVSNFPAVQPVSDNGGSLTVDGTVGISGTVPVSGPATDAQLRATPLPVSGTVGVSGTIPVSGPLTDAQLRASGVPVTHGGLTDAQLRATAVPVSGPLTDAQIRATALPVSGTVTATGPLTDTQLRASAVPVSLASVPTHGVTGTFWQAVQPVSMSAASTLFTGRASTFRTPGRAGTAGQKILSLHNATGSAVTVKVKKVVVDFACTVVKAITILPPVIRLWKVTVLPTNGTALSKVKIAGSTTSNAAVTVLGDASADGTSSASALTATLPAGQILTQEYAPRFVTAAGYEPADRIEFQAATEDITLGPLEGVVLFLDYVLATQNPITDMWLASIEWTEQ
jgi:hypothetical protein